MQVKKNIHLCQEKNTHWQVIPQQSTQNTTNLQLQTYEKNKWTFYWHLMGVGFSFRNNFANLGSFAKVSFPVAVIIP